MDCECELVCVMRISGWQGKEAEAESVWHFLLRRGLPGGQTLKLLYQYEIFIKRLCSNKKMYIFRINKRRTF